MATSKRANKTGKAKAGAAKLDLLDEIEQRVEEAVRDILKKNMGVTELIKIRDVVREILAERPHEVVVRWVDDDCDTTAGGTESEVKKDRGPDGEPSKGF